MRKLCATQVKPFAAIAYSQLQGDQLVLSYSTIGTSGAMLTFLQFLELTNNSMSLPRTSPFLLCVFSRLLFAVNTQRLLFIGFPVIMIMALRGLDNAENKLQDKKYSIVDYESGICQNQFRVHRDAVHFLFCIYIIVA